MYVDIYIHVDNVFSLGYHKISTVIFGLLSLFLSIDLTFFVTSHGDPAGYQK